MKSSRPSTLWLLPGVAAVIAGYTWKYLRPRHSFRGQNVVITGGSRGLGLALARRFAKEGARLGLIARDINELHRATVELRQLGAEVYSVDADLNSSEQAERAVLDLLEIMGQIDLLINNAGEIVVAPLEHLDVTDFQQAMAIHAWAPLTTMLTVLPEMVARGNGRIVNIASFGGRIPVPHLASYSMSKFALVGLSQALGIELRKKGIYVTTVCPGLMRTGSHLNAWFKGQQTDEFTWFALGAATPGLSMSAERAAKKIMEACRRGRPYLMMPARTRIAEIAFTLMPNISSEVLALINRLLPTPGGGPGERKLRGWESQSKWAPSGYTHLIDSATEKYNGLAGHSAAGLYSAEKTAPNLPPTRRKRVQQNGEGGHGHSSN